jgi:hypothetical protein
MLLKGLFISLISFALYSSPAQAAFRISGGLGFGANTTADEISQSEGPFTQLYTFDYLLHSRLAIGVEHLRSLNMSPLATSISFTGGFARFYLNGAPTPYSSANDINNNEMIVRDIAYFYGFGFGLAQSSILPDENNKSSNAAGVYLSPRVGMEMSMTRRTGFRGELMTAMTVFGAGSISSFSLIGSVYYSF